MRLPRMTTRRWMVAVAVIALIYETHALWRRSLDLRLKAARYDVSASFHKSKSNNYRISAARLANDEHAQIAEREAREAAFYERMAQEYRHAAARPWLNVTMESPPAE
jgi:hypothetical protein